MEARLLGPRTNVLVTGATGLIGGELVRRLARMRLGELWVLVRPRGDTAAAARFRKRMGRSGERDDAELHDRVAVMIGDITLPDWDLAPSHLERVTNEVDLIIHCAADTSFLCREAVQATNVTGTRRLIELARRCQRRPTIVYMSTATNNGKMSHRCLGEEEGCRPDNEHHNAYTHSKAVAERMLRDSGLRVLTLRPSIVMSAGVPDAAFARHMLWFVPLLRKYACLPADADSRVDVVPVSFVVEATLALLVRPELRHDCYHLSAGAEKSVRLGEANEVAERFYGRKRPLRLIHPACWTPDDLRQNIKSRLQRRIFFGLSCYLPFLNMDVVYDNRRLRDELGPAFPALPPFVDYLHSLLDQLRSKRTLLEEIRNPEPEIGSSDRRSVPTIP